MCAGFGITPQAHDPMADYFTKAELDSALSRMREAIAQAQALAVPHETFLASSGASPFPTEVGFQRP